MKNLIKVYGTFIRIAPFAAVVTIFYFLLDAATPALTTLFLGNIFQGLADFLAEQQSMALLIQSILCFLGLRFVWYIANYGYSVLVNTGIFEKGTMYFRIILREKTTRLPMVEFERIEVQEMKRKAERAVEEEVLPMLFHQTLSTMLSAVATTLVAVVLARYHMILLAVALFTVCPYLITQVIRGKQHNRMKNAQVTMLRKADYYWKLLTEKDSVKEMRMLGCVNYISGLWETTEEQIQKECRKEEYKDTFVKAGCGLFQLVGYLGAIMLTLFFTINGEIEAYVFGAVVSAISSMQNTTRVFLESIGEIPEMYGVMQNYFRFMEIPEEEWGKQCNLRLGESISLENVDFAYPDTNKMTLRHVNVEINRGEKIAIVGENGSGKTTLSKILLGVYRVDSGKVCWDGLPYQEYSEREWYRHISVVSQDFVKYYLMLRENVAISDLKRLWDDETLWESIKKMKMEDTISLDSQLGREYGGMELSGGQWQKLSIARGIFKDSDFIVLDEPTSSLDPIIESEVLLDFLEAIKKQTAVIITHRIGICHKVDRVIVMKEGKIVECGSHEELLRQKGEYFRLYEAQASWYMG